MKKTYTIAGEKILTKNYLEVMDPSTQKVLGKVPALTSSEVDKIYKFAKSNQKAWEELTISERALFLNKWADLLYKGRERLAKLMTKEIAKNFNDSLVEIERTVEYIRYTVEEMYRIDSTARTSEQFYGGKKNKISITTKVPYGVVLVISPFNYPVNLSISKIAPALISGNVVVFKPATQGSLVGVELFNLWEKTGAPKGVVNIVTGRGRDISDYLIEHNNVDFINFTGSTNVGKLISAKVSLIPQIMELGGKDPAIILDDANLDNAADDIISGAFSYSGQRCTATKRVLVSKKNKSKLEELLLQRVKNVTFGMPMDNSMVTPMIDSKSLEFVQDLIRDLNPNAKILHGNNIKGNLMEPTLITNVLRTDRLAIEEQFGPVLPIIEYSSIEEAIKIANESEFGLQASLYGTDINKLLTISNKIEAGSVNINSKSSRGPDNFPFIGFKNSGMGVQGIRDSIISMTQPKSIVINIKNN